MKNRQFAGIQVNALLIIAFACRKKRFVDKPASAFSFAITFSKVANVRSKTAILSSVPVTERTETVRMTFVPVSRE